jgi:two-component system response regulator FixJ
MAETIRIALIDDDEAVLDSLGLFLTRKGVLVHPFASADAFLTQAGALDGVNCIVADVRMPGLSGVDLVRRLQAERVVIPVILITGHGDVDMAVAAIKLGAFDFIEKPFDEMRLLESIRKAGAQLRRDEDAAAQLRDLKSRRDSLSERQQQVMDLAAGGLSNKEIGQQLGISPRTVEIHRAWMMERMGARNLADLVRVAMQLKEPS